MIKLTYKDKKFLKISGIWISIFVIIRLFIFDFAGLDMIFKLLAFMTLGIVLMIISSGFYFVMAMRELQINNTPYNKMIALLCVCAGIFAILGWRVFNIFTSLIDFQK